MSEPNREGPMSSGDFIGDKPGEGIHTCHAGCPCQQGDSAREGPMSEGGERCYLCEQPRRRHGIPGPPDPPPNAEQIRAGAMAMYKDAYRKLCEYATGAAPVPEGDCPDCGGGGIKDINAKRAGLTEWVTCHACFGTGQQTSDAQQQTTGGNMEALAERTTGGDNPPSVDLPTGQPIPAEAKRVATKAVAEVRSFYGEHCEDQCESCELIAGDTAKAALTAAAPIIREQERDRIARLVEARAELYADEELEAIAEKATDDFQRGYKIAWGRSARFHLAEIRTAIRAVTTQHTEEGDDGK